MNIFFLGVVHFSVCYFPSPRDIVYFASSKTSIEVIGKIITRPQIREGKRKNITFIIEAKKIRTDKKEETTWQKTEGKVWVRSFFPYKYYGYGDIIKIKGKLKIPDDFNWQRYLSYQGIWTEINTGKIDVLKRRKGNPLYHFALSSGEWIRSTIDKNLPPLSSAVLKAIMLGDKEYLPNDLLRKFRSTGTAHVFVVSGLHVGLLAFVVFTLLRACGFSPRICYLVVLPLVGYYASITGFRPPIVRASLMMTVGIICFFLDRDVPLLIVLLLATLVILFINPLSLFMVSFQLSFITVGGIIYLTPYLEESLRFLSRGVKRAFSVSCAAQLALLPLLAFYFGQFPLIGVVSNLIITPLITAALALGFFSVCLTLLPLYFAKIMFNTTWLVLHFLLHFVDFLSFSWAPHLVSFFSPHIASFPIEMLFLYYMLLIFLPYRKYFSKK